MIDATQFGKAAGDAGLSAAELSSRVADVLSGSGAASWALKAGVPAPGFALYDCDGSTVSLNGALAAGPVVVTFHGGLWCPSSTRDLHALEAALPEYTRLGASLLANSPQTQLHNRSARDKAGTSFPLLADPRNRVAAAYGVLVKLPPALIQLYKRCGINLPALTGDESWALPLPARFVITPDRTIHYAEVGPDFACRPDPLQLLPVLSRHGACRTARIRP